MLIIFDLDDTLIDTSGSITPQVLKNALYAMQKGGLCLTNPKKALKQFLHINTMHMSSDDSLKEFLELTKAPEVCYNIGRKEIYDFPSLPETILPVEGAVELLEELSKTHILALVTKGRAKVQREKMKKASIDENLFSTISFCTEQSKKISYQEMSKKTGISPKKSLVCGDRIYFDLTPAKELGFKTVQIMRGRGLCNTGLKNDVDYTILHLRELKKILGKLQTEVDI